MEKINDSVSQDSGHINPNQSYQDQKVAGEEGYQSNLSGIVIKTDETAERFDQECQPMDFFQNFIERLKELEQEEFLLPTAWRYG